MDHCNDRRARPRLAAGIGALVALAALGFGARPAPAAVDTLRLDRRAVEERALEGARELAHWRAAQDEAARLGRVSDPLRPEIALELEGDPAPWSGSHYTRRIAMEQEVDLRDARAARRRVGGALAAVVERERDERARQIVAEVDLEVSRLLVAWRRVELLGPLRARARELRDKADAARRRETLTAFDARQLAADALRLEARWAEAFRELEETRAVLAARLGVGRDTVIDVGDDLDAGAWGCAEERVVAAAMAARPALARAAAAESLAAAQVALERRLAVSNPLVGISAARERTEEAGLAQTHVVLGVGVRMTLPVFAGNPTGLANARLDLERARGERATLERETRQEAASACAALARAEARRALLDEAAAPATEDLALVEGAYAGGRIALGEYLNLRERLVDTQLERLDAWGAVEEARARLVRITGLRRDALERAISEGP